jgi:hypothetical protein
MILPLLCNFNTVFAGYEQLWSLCNIQGLINSFQQWTNSAGLQTIFWRFFYDIGDVKDLYDAIPTCTSNFYTCGTAAGKAYSTLTLWTIGTVTPTPTPPNLGNAAFNNFPVFFDGLVQGLNSDALNAVRDDVFTILKDLGEIRDGDYTLIQTVAADYAAIKEKLEAFELPTVSYEVVAFKAMMNMHSIQEKIAEFDTCEAHACGQILGDIINTLLL